MKNNKKEKEFRILTKIYDQKQFKELDEGEKPDFKFVQNTGYSFGVEITEFYYSEVNARIVNIPHYVNEILSDRKYRHKKDINELVVKEMYIKSEEKPDVKIHGIVIELPKPNEYIKKLNKLIVSKNKKYLKYNKTLGHINLIIYDAEKRLLRLIKTSYMSIILQMN